jgi:hypothetical protein
MIYLNLFADFVASSIIYWILAYSWSYKWNETKHRKLVQQRVSRK